MIYREFFWYEYQNKKKEKDGGFLETHLLCFS